eukprot:SAG11_NODE_792_length_7143_cov_38.103492_5_plen_151_part_00
MEKLDGLNNNEWEYSPETSCRFTYLWEPSELGALRYTLRYSGNELLVQRAFVEGWDRNKIIAEGIQGDMDNHNLNSRNELEVYHSDYGYAVVIPRDRPDLFRAIVKWTHGAAAAAAAAAGAAGGGQRRGEGGSAAARWRRGGRMGATREK